MSLSTEQPEGTRTGIATYAAACAALLTSAAFLGLRWADLPDPIPVFITPFGEVARSAPKSLWSVMRLPVMGLLTVGIIAVTHLLASRASVRASQRRQIRIFFTGVLIAVALKMVPNILSLQYVREGRIRGPGLVLHYMASLFAIVGVIVILFALVRLKGAEFRWKEASGNKWTALLAVLCCSYAAAVFAPIS